MPYRRLPNTDAARIRALTNAINKTMSMHPDDIAYSYKVLQNAKFFLPTFKTGINYQRADYSQSVEKNSNYNSLQKRAKMYISHFIQVLNMAIARDEMPADARSFYGLEKFTKKLPPLTTDDEIIAWGKKLIDGEEARVQQGGNPMVNPRIAMVKIQYDKYVNAYRSNSFIQSKNERAFEYVQELRQKADDIILSIWNEVEQTFAHLPAAEKRKQAEEYGLVYVFRKHEKPEDNGNN
ncbi:MAG TPA: hypothetical protein PK734_02985 [Bacteroidales bacterium]|nr:MAG: hypothetical protein BWY22_00319 [Bacteroidetes bacterium ADurb.Bin217]HPM12439.1 hypothetical protein [Bacteroidales bacterium]